MTLVAIGEAFAVLAAPTLAAGGATTSRLLAVRDRIVALAESQVGYSSNPSNTYCNKFSAYFSSGISDCANANLDEQWCADFAAWTWKLAGADVVYRWSHGDLNASAASFYEWGLRMRTWHPVDSTYRPEPGDVAIYGLDPGALWAAHVAVVVGYHRGERGPEAVNGDGDLTGFSVVERANDEVRADLTSTTYSLSGYVSPSLPPPTSRG